MRYDIVKNLNDDTNEIEVKLTVTEAKIIYNILIDEGMAMMLHYETAKKLQKYIIQDERRKKIKKIEK
jgi:hypothetical protein